MSYRDYQVQRAPPWLRGPVGTGWAQAQGEVKDGLTARGLAGVEQRFPTRATGGALVALGEERGIARGPGESLESWAERIRRAWDIWQAAGTANGVLVALSAAGYPDARISIARATQYQLDADGNLVIIALPPDAFLIRLDGGFWSEFLVILDREQPGLGWQSSLNNPEGYPPPLLSGAPPDEFLQLLVRITVEGEVGTMNEPEFAYSYDNGASWSASIVASPAVPIGIGGGRTLTWSITGVYLDPSAPWEFVVRLVPTAAQVALVATVVNAFKPAFATYAGLSVISQGHTLDYTNGIPRTMDAAGIPQLNYSYADWYPYP